MCGDIWAAGIRWPNDPGTWADWVVAVGSIGTLLFTGASAFNSWQAARASQRAAEEATRSRLVDDALQVSESVRQWYEDIGRVYRGVKDVTAAEGGFPEQERLLQELQEDSFFCLRIRSQMGELINRLRSGKPLRGAEDEIRKAKMDLLEVIEMSLNRQRNYHSSGFIIRVMEDRRPTA